MDPSFLFYIFLAAGILICLVIALVFLLPKVLKNIGGQGRGWTTLAEHFPTASQPPGELLKRQTIEVGQVVYKRCVRVGITPQGLYLDVNLPFSSRLKPLLIPWEMVKGVREGTLYWEKTRILSIGEPEIGTISFFSTLVEKARPYLKG
ncbi:MAG: hypothetical protein HY787_16210 [Deltaproteobacteria bacterium]|nr:hypothetical protein [Deltaproteobacteria bacterium]